MDWALEADLKRRQKLLIAIEEDGQLYASNYDLFMKDNIDALKTVAPTTLTCAKMLNYQIELLDKTTKLSITKVAQDITLCNAQLTTARNVASIGSCRHADAIELFQHTKVMARNAITEEVKRYDRLVAERPKLESLARKAFSPQSADTYLSNLDKVAEAMKRVKDDVVEAGNKVVEAARLGQGQLKTTPSTGPGPIKRVISRPSRKTCTRLPSPPRRG